MQQLDLVRTDNRFSFAWPVLLHSAFWKIAGIVLFHMRLFFVVSHAAFVRHFFETGYHYLIDNFIVQD